MKGIKQMTKLLKLLPDVVTRMFVTHKVGKTGDHVLSRAALLFIRKNVLGLKNAPLMEKVAKA